MPTITVSKIDLESLIGKKMSFDELQEKLPLVKGEIKDFEGDELKIELADTNRPDLWCAEGIARELRVESSEFRVERQKTKYQIFVDTELKDIRPYIGGFVAKNIKIDEPTLLGLIQTQEKLADGFGRHRKNISIGFYRASQITFPLFYKAVEQESYKFVPLDSDTPQNLKEILESHPKGIEYGSILKGFARFPIFVDENDKVLSFPPIINARDIGELKSGDTEILCEVTGTDLEGVLLILNILSYNLFDRGAKIIPIKVEYPYSTPLGKSIITPYDFNERLTIKKNEFEQLLGMKLNIDEIVRILKNMGYKLPEHQKTRTPEHQISVVEVISPSYRKDIMHPVDVIEDFAIGKGYNSFETEDISFFTIGKPAPVESTLNKVRDIMIGSGFEEIISNILTRKSDDPCSTWVPRSQKSEMIEIENYMTETYSVLRNTLIPSLLNIEAHSPKAGYPHKIFEIGEVVIKDEKTDLRSRTFYNLGVLLAHPEASFSEIHSFLEILSRYLNFTYIFEKGKSPSFIKGRDANIMINKKQKGIIGEIHPQVLENWGIRMPVAVFEIYDIASLH